MEVQALTRNARMSPKKVREVARTIQGRMANDAVEYLTLIPRKSARLIVKTLKSAIANAENNNNLASDTLTVKSASSCVSNHDFPLLVIKQPLVGGPPTRGRERIRRVHVALGRRLKVFAGVMLGKSNPERLR